MADQPITEQKPASQSPAKSMDLTGRTLGGYKVRRMLGAGGMGAVCLANQISLDRDVALKILPEKMAKNPDFLYRFTREALSAARLTHHNIVQTYDIGSAGQLHYISMEFVDGKTLGELVRDKGPLDPYEAASYVLQAARGLQYAHDIGIIHRDIKPDNLMVNEQGIVKIADMGLAKMRGETRRDETIMDESERQALLEKAKGDLTIGDIAMGTPTYMPPEQASDASSVDHRADQYSLGCTFYGIIAGRPPYAGTSAYDMISKHMSEPVPMLDREVEGVPPEVGSLISRMMAKQKEDRYPDMSVVIEDLEAILGQRSGSSGPTQIQRRAIADLAAAYYKTKGSSLRKPAILSFVIGVPIFALIMYVVGDAGISYGLWGMLALTPLAKFIIEGMSSHTYLFRRAKPLAVSLGAKFWGTVAGIAFVSLIILGIIGFVVAVVGAIAAAFAYLKIIKAPLIEARRDPVEQARHLLREMRAQGQSEDDLHAIVADVTGDHWEEFFEDLFGYEAMIAAREQWGVNENGKPRKRSSTWREPVVGWLERIEEQQKASRERRQLQEAEAKRLAAQGINQKDARRQAEAAAEAFQREQQLAQPAPARAKTRRKPATTKKPAKPKKVKQKPAVAARRERKNFGVGSIVHLIAAVLIALLFGAYTRMNLAILPDALVEESNLIFTPVVGIGFIVAHLLAIFSMRRASTFWLTVGSVIVIFSKPIGSIVDSLDLGFLGSGQVEGLGLILGIIGIGVPILTRLMGNRF